MPFDPPKPPIDLPRELVIEEPEDGAFSCYSNYINIAWTVHDIEMQFCELVDVSTKAPSAYTPKLHREAVIKVSWMQAKQIAELLTGIVSKYEALNGKLPNPADIKTP